MLTILLWVDGFKLHNMVADFLLYWEICVDHTILPMRSDLFSVHRRIMLFETIYTCSVGSFVETRLKLCFAHLISLHRRQAQMDIDSDSNHVRYFNFIFQKKKKMVFDHTQNFFS